MIIPGTFFAFSSVRQDFFAFVKSYIQSIVLRMEDDRYAPSTAQKTAG